MTRHTETPPPWTSTAEAFKKPSRPYFNSSKKLPPFARQLNPANQNSLVILTGSKAWARAKSPSYWFPGSRLVLPFGDDPTAYRWPVAGRDCVLFGFGEQEPRKRLVALSVELVRAGAVFVIWGWAVPAVGPLCELPSPFFGPGASHEG
jgi:hypothetical protein